MDYIEYRREVRKLKRQYKRSRRNAASYNAGVAFGFGIVLGVAALMNEAERRYLEMVRRNNHQESQEGGA